MVMQLPHRRPQAIAAVRKVGPYFGRLIVILAAFMCGMLSTAALVPGAFAAMAIPGWWYATSPVGAAVITAVRAVGIGLAPGWEIALFALDSVLVVAVATDVLLGLRRTARRTPYSASRRITSGAPRRITCGGAA
jgi:hypothetical protein